MKKEDFENQMAELAKSNAPIHAEIVKQIADLTAKADGLETEKQALTNSVEELEAEKAALTDKIDQLEDNPAAKLIVAGTYKQGNKTSQFKPGWLKFNYAGTIHESETAIKDKALMKELVEIGFGGLEEVKK